MEKFGTEEVDEPADKQATDREKCPQCGKQLRPRSITGIRVCPDCGTKPFEEKR